MEVNRRFVLIAVSTIALAVALTTLSAAKAASQPPLSVSVWTDKAEYYVGETVRIYFTVNKDAYVRLWIRKPNGEIVYLGSGLARGGLVYYFSGVAGCPPGMREVHVEASADGEYASDTTYFDVKLVFKVEVTVKVSEDGTAQFTVFYTPVYTSWTTFCSLCYNEYASSFHSEQADLVREMTGVSPADLTVVEKGTYLEGFYTKVLVDLKHSPYSSAREAVYKFRNPIAGKSDRVLTLFRVYCSGGVYSVSPPATNVQASMASWEGVDAKDVDEFTVTGFVVVSVKVEGLPSGARVKVVARGVSSGRVSEKELRAGETAVLRLPGGDAYEVSVSDSVEVDKYGYLAKKSKEMAEPGATVVFQYTGPYFKLEILCRYSFEINVLGRKEKLPLRMWVDPGRKIVVEVPQEVNFGNATRLLFMSWSDGVKDPVREFLMDKPVVVEVLYSRQYYVKVNDPIGKASGVTLGEGWYDEGAVANLEIKSDAVYVSDVERYVFAGWYGDVSSSERRVAVKVTRPLTVNVVWKHQFKLTVVGEHAKAILDPPSPDGWYDEGTTVRVKIESETVSDTPFTGFAFKGWVREDTGQVISAAELTVKVDKPIKLRALWERTYNVPLIALTVLVAVAASVSLFVFRRREVAEKLVGIKEALPAVRRVREVRPAEVRPERIRELATKVKPPTVPREHLEKIRERVPKVALPKPPAPPPKPPLKERPPTPVLPKPAAKPPTERPPERPPVVTGFPKHVAREDVLRAAEGALRAGVINQRMLSVIQAIPLEDEETRARLYRVLLPLSRLSGVIDRKEMDKVHREAVRDIVQYLEGLLH